MKKLLTSFLVLSMVVALPLSVSASEVTANLEPDGTSIVAAAECKHNWTIPRDGNGTIILGSREYCTKCGITR